MKSLDSFNENRIIDLDGFVFVLGFFFFAVFWLFLQLLLLLLKHWMLGNEK